MRIGIIANSVNAALKIHRAVKRAGNCEVFILLVPTPGRSRWRNVAASLARTALQPAEWTTSMVSLRNTVLFSKPLDHPQSLEQIKALKLDVGLHKSGTIYRRPTIDAFRLGILNAHIGILPQYRGRSVMEWSLLQADKVGVTVFFVDEGIDTGRRIVLSEEVDISHCNSIAEAKKYLFDLDASLFSRALTALLLDESGGRLSEGTGRRYFVMSQLFQGVVEQLLQGNN